jgi:hypothetical protein
MRCLDIAGMVVAESAADAFRISVIGDDIRILREPFSANRTDAVLLDNFSVHQFPHLGRRAELSISPWVMRIFDTLYAESDELRLGHHTTPTAGDGSVNGTQFVTTEFHDDSFLNVC